jgi:hypothetical protein
MLDKIKRLESLLYAIDPSMDLHVEDKDGTKLVYGPFPSFLIHITDNEERFLIHVNADAPNMVYYMSAIIKEFPEMIHDGAFAVDTSTSQLILGQDAFIKKEENILNFAREILEKRQEVKKEQLILPEEKKIVIARK